ncbi:PI-PLC X domain-containing protein 1 [Hypsizygus marmoreus]|uniref:PI-PLC X domain-containing protein 1 n=1 Tax=Hypsizygus marmoreus TaxID=39966 RepID=A0A369K5I8_HYPMA|nr:PI-PLC X domain-containing protein 1 [Hypsizygus marmoreus]
MLAPKYLTQVVIFLLCSVTVIQALAPARRATVCNGHAELCDKGYGTVSFVGTHDSYAVGVNNLAVNQDHDITQQLNDGIRMLQMQAHIESGAIRLCHTSCSVYDGGTLEDYLKTVKKWLDANPNEVLSLLIVNIDNVGAAQYDTVFKTVGLDAVSHAPESSPLGASAWPTLGAMIDSGKRLVTFLDNGADATVAPYLIDEFTNIWETAFNVVDPALFDCSVNRTKGDTATQMYLINHFLDKLLFGQPVPDVAKANVTNAATGDGSLGAHVQTCIAVNTRAPNFLLVDFYEYGGGSVFEVAASINGVTYSPTSAIAQPVSTSSGTSSPSGTSGSGSGNGALPISRQHLLAFLAVAASIIAGSYTVI